MGAVLCVDAVLTVRIVGVGSSGGVARALQTCVQTPMASFEGPCFSFAVGCGERAWPDGVRYAPGATVDADGAISQGVASGSAPDAVLRGASWHLWHLVGARHRARPVERDLRRRQSQRHPGVGGAPDGTGVTWAYGCSLLGEPGRGTGLDNVRLGGGRSTASVAHVEGPGPSRP